MATKSSAFTGTVSLTILEAQNLRSTTLPGGFQLQSKDMDPYCVVDIDDLFLGRTQAKTKTPCPVWNENFEETVEDGARMQVTIFHNSTIPPDPFIAHSIVNIQEMIAAKEEEFVVSTCRQHTYKLLTCFTLR